MMYHIRPEGCPYAAELMITKNGRTTFAKYEGAIVATSTGTPEEMQADIAPLLPQFGIKGKVHYAGIDNAVVASSKRVSAEKADALVARLLDQMAGCAKCQL